MSFEATTEQEPSETANPLSEPPAARDYIHLKGKVGAEAFHRPDRYPLRELVEAPRRFLLEVGGRKVRALNFSLAGLSFRDEEHGIWDVGAETHYRVSLQGKTVIEGAATVARITDKGARGVEVGLSSEATVDYESLSVAERNLAWAEGLARPPRLLEGAVPDDYRKAVLELSAFVQYYSGLLGRREQHNPGDRKAIAAEAFTALLPGWEELREEASRTALPFIHDKATLQQGRALAEALVTPYLVRAPVLRQTFEKPFGYPGDYVLMQYYFENDFVGDSAFGMVFHKTTCEHPLAVGVRTRAEYVADRIAERAMQVNGSGPLRVLSLGCGVAQEVVMVHRDRGIPVDAVEWSLIDQEDQALAHAHRNARAAVAAGCAPPRIHCFNVAYSQIARMSVDPGIYAEQDVVFGLGLFDYLPALNAGFLLAQLYNHLRPGGAIYAGNATGPNHYFWELELALRWTLIYRDTEGMMGLTRGLPHDAVTSVETEPTGAYHILTCKKP